MLTNARAQTGLSGTLTLYTSEVQDNVQEQVDAFKKQYPGTDVKLFRSGTGEVALLCAEGRAALHVTHDPDEALTVADRVVLGAGRVLDEGEPLSVYGDPAKLASARAAPAQRAAALGARRRGPAGRMAAS